MANIILTTMGTGGDVFPFITIGTALKARGHKVTLLTHRYYSDEAQKAKLEFAALDSAEESEQMMQDGPLLNTPKGLLSFLDRHVLPKTLIEYELIREYCSAEDTILVTRSGPGFAARMASERLKVPIVAVLMAPAHVLGLPLFEGLVESTIGPRLNDLRLQLGLRTIEQWKPWLRYPVSIGLWPDWYCSLDPSWPSGIHLTGFTLSDDPRQGTVEGHLRHTLTNNGPYALITAGTGLFGGSDFFEVMLESCRIAGCRALLISRHQKLLPERLPEGCLYFPSVPSLGGLMPLVSVVCHHGGMGTIGQAIAAGTPQLIMAAGGDRPDNAVRLKKLGVAEFIEARHRSPDMVAAALSRLINSESVKQRCRYLASRFREVSSPDLTCEIIDGAIQNASLWSKSQMGG